MRELTVLTHAPVVGFIPTARYPTALAMVGAELFVGNGKGEAIEAERAYRRVSSQREAARGVCAVALPQQPASARHPEPAALGALTTLVLQANGLIGERVDRLFARPSPIAHVIYIIKENCTDQVFGDLAVGRRHASRR